MSLKEDGQDAREIKMLLGLRSQLEHDGDAFIERTASPTSDDFKLIGKVVQLYCYADFCARRIIDCISEAKSGSEARRAMSLRDHDVLKKLREAGEALTNENHRETIFRAADCLEMHRKTRHLFAHWVVRRVRRKQAFLLLSKNADEGGKRHGRTLNGQTSSYGLQGLNTLRREVKKLEDHTHNLSMMAPLFERNQGELNDLLRD